MRDVTNSVKEDKSGGITYTIKVIPKENPKVNPEIIENVIETKIEKPLETYIQSEYYENNNEKYKFEGSSKNSNEDQNTESYRSRISGSKNNQYNQPKNPHYQKVRNNETLIDGIEFGGHALDRMQDRGITPSVVKEAINYGQKIEARSGRIKYYDAKNNITVITEKSGKVVTVRYGK